MADVGGLGGGVVIITASVILNVSGVLASDGAMSSAFFGSGGGSGGSVLIRTKAIYGNGMISANGGLGMHIYIAL